MRKLWLKVVIAVVVLVLLVFGLVPLFFNADALRPRIESELTSALGRKVTLGRLSFSLLAGSLHAEDLSVADDAAFSAEPFLEAKRLSLGVEVGQFLFHRTMRITNLTVDSPSIQLIHNQQNGTWNFSSLGGGSQQPPLSKDSSQQSAIAIPDLIVDKIAIKDGSATLASIPAAGKPLSCTTIDFSLQRFSVTQPFPFQLSLKLPGDGTFELNGTAGPISPANVAATPFQATLDLKHFDPVAAGLLQPGDGISMLADFHAKIASDGTSLTSNGKVKASRLHLSRNGSPAPQPVDLDYAVSEQLAARAGKVTDLTVHTGSVAVHTAGAFQMTGPATLLDLHMTADSLPIDQIEQLLPAVGVTLPTGSQLRGGTLTAHLAITGPVAAATIAGPVEIDNTALAGFDLGSRIEGLTPFGGTKNGTEIQKLSTDLNSSPQATRFDNLFASVPVLGTATGSGAVSPAGALDFQLTVKLSNSSLVGGVANAGMEMMGMLGGQLRNATSNGIPLTITGTTSNPKIRANVSSMLKQGLSRRSGQSSGQQPTNPVNVLKGLFGR